MKNRLCFLETTKKNQNGTASIVSALIIIILLSLISVGFAKIMSRSLQESLNSNLASAADYAAQSGINDAIAYIKAHGTGAVTDCNALNGSPPKKINYNISEETKYTCVLIDPTSTDLVYQKVDPYTSRVVDVSGAAKLMFSWESTEGFSNLPVNGSKLLDETTWANDENAPILRLTLYAMRNDFRVEGIDTKTYFLYPSSGGTNRIKFESVGLNGTIQYINCNNKDLNSIFNGSADKNCNVVVDVPASATLYARVTPLYAKTDIKIKGNTSSGDAAQFINQTKIDVTAQSSGATKRLQVRIDKTPEIPEYALRTTNLLCKRITIAPDPYGLDMDFGSDLSDTDCAAPLDYGSGGITEE